MRCTCTLPSFLTVIELCLGLELLHVHFPVLEKVKSWSQGWLVAAGAYPGFCSMKRLEVFLLLLDGMLVHHRSLPGNFVRFPQQIAGTHLYTWVERGTVRVKCLAQEHNTLSPARTWPGPGCVGEVCFKYVLFVFYLKGS